MDRRPLRNKKQTGRCREVIYSFVRRQTSGKFSRVCHYFHRRASHTSTPHEHAVRTCFCDREVRAVLVAPVAPTTLFVNGHVIASVFVHRAPCPSWIFRFGSFNSFIPLISSVVLPIDMTDKDAGVYRAKLAEQAERYEGLYSFLCAVLFLQRVARLGIIDGISLLYVGQI